MSQIPDHLWSMDEAAHFLGMPKKTLYQLNHRKIGPAFYRLGKRVMFIPEEVMAWVATKKVGGVIL